MLTVLFDPVLLIMLGLMCVFWGACASFARGSGSGSGFIWGFLLGPFGVIVAAVKGVGDRVETLTAAINTATASTSRTKSPIRVRTRHNSAPAQEQVSSVVTCPQCGNPVDPPEAPGTYACPHCGKAVEFA